MNRHRFLLLSALWMATAVFSAVGQTPSNSSFEMKYRTSGISSLQRAEDKYETDYIQSGYTLGDITIRYRAGGTGAWSEISAAARDRNARGGTETYTINRLQPTLAASANVSASVRGLGARVLNAAFEPSISHDIGAPRFTWAGKTGSY